MNLALEQAFLTTLTAFAAKNNIPERQISEPREFLHHQSIFYT